MGLYGNLAGYAAAKLMIILPPFFGEFNRQNVSYPLCK